MNKYVIGLMSLATVATLAVAIPTFAETKAPVGANGANMPKGGALNMQRGNAGGPGLGRTGMMKPSVIGTVSTVSGNTLTVLGHTGFGKTATATTTYTVDATNAKVMKNNATSSVSNIVVGDTVAVQGTVTGTNIVATMIRDGIMARPGMGFGRGQGDNQGNKMGTSTNPAITGNGQPVIAGTISTINGSTISVTNKSNVAYTVDATNAKILQGNNTTQLPTLKVGDTVIVQGTVNGTSITASSIIDQSKPANVGQNPHPGFFGGIGQFFTHLFGF